MRSLRGRGRAVAPQPCWHCPGRRQRCLAAAGLQREGRAQPTGQAQPVLRARPSRCGPAVRPPTPTPSPSPPTADLFASLRSSVCRAPDEQHSPQDDARLCAGWSAAAQAAQEAFVDATAVQPDSCAVTLGSKEFLLEDPYQGASCPPPTTLGLAWQRACLLQRSLLGNARPAKQPWQQLEGMRGRSQRARQIHPPEAWHTSPPALASPDFLPAADVALSDRCPLLARKFSRHAAKWVHKVYRSCSAALGVLPCSQRLTDRDNNWWSR